MSADFFKKQAFQYVLSRILSRSTDWIQIRQAANRSRSRPILFAKVINNQEKSIPVIRGNFVCYLCLSLPYCHVCFLQPCVHLLGKGLPLGSLVCDVYLRFCHIPIRCLGQVWYFSVSIPDLCILPYFKR